MNDWEAVDWEAVISHWKLDDGVWQGTVQLSTRNDVNVFDWFVEHKLLDIRAGGKEQTSKEAITAATSAYVRLREAFKAVP